MMFFFGRGGIVGWGSICGCLTSAAGVINLIGDRNQTSKLQDEVMTWYTKAEFPQYQPAGLDLATTVANSTLCHVSVTTWCQHTGIARGDSKRGERCAGVTADTAAFVADILNQEFIGDGYTPKYAIADSVDQCMSCHGEHTIGKDDCVPCHRDAH